MTTYGSVPTDTPPIERVVDLQHGGVTGTPATPSSAPGGGLPQFGSGEYGAKAAQALAIIQDTTSQAISAFRSSDAGRKIIDTTSEYGTMAKERWDALPPNIRKGIGITLVILLVFNLFFGGSSSSSSSCVAMGREPAASTAREMRQLPCFSGSCDNWALVGAPVGDETCDKVSAAFGCQPCKRDPVPIKLQRDLNATGKWLVCPRPPSAGKVVSAGGFSYTAQPACQDSSAVREEYNLYRVPCWSGSCEQYLIEVDQRDLLTNDEICNNWATAFCGMGSTCKTSMQVAEDDRLTAFTESMPPGRPNSGRIFMCKKSPSVGTRVTASGIGYTVAPSTFWLEIGR